MIKLQSNYGNDLFWGRLLLNNNVGAFTAERYISEMLNLIKLKFSKYLNIFLWAPNLSKNLNINYY